MPSRGGLRGRPRKHATEALAYAAKLDSNKRGKQNRRSQASLAAPSNSHVPAGMSFLLPPLQRLPSRLFRPTYLHTTITELSTIGSLPLLAPRPPSQPDPLPSLSPPQPSLPQSPRSPPHRYSNTSSPVQLDNRSRSISPPGHQQYTTSASMDTLSALDALTLSDSPTSRPLASSLPVIHGLAQPVHPPGPFPDTLSPGTGTLFDRGPHDQSFTPCDFWDDALFSIPFSTPSPALPPTSTHSSSPAHGPNPLDSSSLPWLLDDDIIIGPLTPPSLDISSADTGSCPNIPQQSNPPSLSNEQHVPQPPPTPRLLILPPDLPTLHSSGTPPSSLSSPSDNAHCTYSPTSR